MIIKSLSIFITGMMLSFNLAANELLGLPVLNIPLNNPQSAAKIALGRKLFHDKQLSGDGKISCASCHDAKKGFTDNRKTAIGINGASGRINTPTLINAAFFKEFFVDGRAESLEKQALGPLLNPIEHGLSNLQQIIDIVTQNPGYRDAIQAAFNIPVNQVSPQHIAEALASFQRTLIAGNSAFDRFFFGTDKTAVSESAARGSRIFRRKGNCANCHEISWNNALFTDNRFYNIGIGYETLSPILKPFYQAILKGADPAEFPLSTEQRTQLGRFNVTRRISDLGKFKTPTLRNIALTAPYMHDGRHQTLREVVEYYDKGGNNNEFQDPAIFPLHLTEQEKTDVVNFMKSLTSNRFLPKTEYKQAVTVNPH